MDGARTMGPSILVIEDGRIAAVGTDVGYIQGLLQKVANQVPYVKDLELIDFDIEIL